MDIRAHPDALGVTVRQVMFFKSFPEDSDAHPVWKALLQVS